ncbi:MAG: hypothetical protein ACLGIO_08905 [Acidimicrobiia bacterium]
MPATWSTTAPDSGVLDERLAFLHQEREAGGEEMTLLKLVRRS